MIATGARCEEPGCPGIPSHGKPYCADHLVRLPYVSRLMTRAEQRAREVDRVRSSHNPQAEVVDPSGPMANDLVTQLQVGGPRTADELASDLHVERFVLRVYLDALEGAGRVTRRRLSGLRELVDVPR